MSHQFIKATIAKLLKQQRGQNLLCRSNSIKLSTNYNHTDTRQQSCSKTDYSSNLSPPPQQKLDSETQREVQHHSNYAKEWWNIDGKMKALHSLNNIRVPFIRDGLVARGNIPSDIINTPQVLRGQRILEVGCGGGILTEQLARLEAHVTGIDLSDDLIQIAREHLSKEADPKLCDLIKYKIEPLDVHVKEKVDYYDAVIISEVLEHVDDKIALLNASVQCLKPGGSLFITTLNKTIPMWIGGVLICEYVLGIAPIGTHHWSKLISPLDVQRILDTMGCPTVVVNGSTYDFWNNTWRWINSTDLCYALQAVKSEL